MCPLALQHSAGLWSRPPSDTSLPCSATTEGIEWASGAAPPAGHAAEASGTARSSHTTEGSKDRAGEGRIKKVRGELGVVRHQRELGGEKWPHSSLQEPLLPSLIPSVPCYIWLCVIWGHGMFSTALTRALSNPHQRLVFCTLTYIPKSSLSFRLSR